MMKNHISKITNPLILRLMTNQSNHELRPVEQNNRINSLDIIRGIALLGILLMNITDFGLAYAYGDPTKSGGSSGWNLKVWIMDSFLKVPSVAFVLCYLERDLYC